MAETARRTWSWRNRLPDLSLALARFPLAVVIALAFTAYRLTYPIFAEAQVRLLTALGVAFLWVVAVDFYVEARRRTLPTRVLLWLAGIAAIGLLFYFGWDLYLSPYLLVIAAVLGVGLSAHLNRGDNAAFWMFNHWLWLAAALAVLGAVLFGAGLSAILRTLNSLFSIGLPARWQEHIWSISLGLIAPVSWLAFAPTNLDERVKEGEPVEFTARAIARIVKIVLVPLLLVYTGILYAYALKIALEWTLPKGTLGSMVVAYLLIGAATLLLAYPTREGGGPLVRLFWRYWVWLVMLPVVLLFLAVYRRIADYGVTEQRYLVALIGAWALLLAILRFWRGDSLDLRLVPLVLAVLLFLASFGPWGAIGLSVLSQKAELARLLEARGVLVDGRIVPKKDTDEPFSRLGTDAGRVRGIEWYLNEHRALSVLAPWFEGTGPNPFAEGKQPEDTQREIFAALGLRPDLAPGGDRFFNHYAKEPVSLATNGKSYLVGPLMLQGGAPDPDLIMPLAVDVEGLGMVRLQASDNGINVKIADGPELRFELLDTAKDLAGRVVPRHEAIVLHAAPVEGVHGTMVIGNFNATFREKDYRLSYLSFWLVLEKTP